MGGAVLGVASTNGRGLPPDPLFPRHAAWRALAPSDKLEPELRRPAVNLLLGRHAHLVHYPVRRGSLVNIVAIIRDDWREPGWRAQGRRAEIPARLSSGLWPSLPRNTR